MADSTSNHTKAQPLQGQKVFITGGSRGIGSAIAMTLAARGATIGISYASRKDAAEKVLAGLPGQGHFCIALDTTQESSVRAATDFVLGQFGTLDGLVNNAGITHDQLLLRMKLEDFESVIRANLVGTYMVTQAFMKSMLKARRGSIVNITSVIGQTGNAGQANYAASKAGIEAFSRSTALEMASRGIRVNCVAPGFIATDMTHSLNEEQKSKITDRIPLQRIGEAAEVATAVAFLLSDDAKYITGHTLSVNGGMFMG